MFVYRILVSWYNDKIHIRRESTFSDTMINVGRCSIQQECSVPLNLCHTVSHNLLLKSPMLIFFRVLGMEI
jgi:hypothetical protein